jgi:glucans biosynthesis protein
MTSDHRRNIGPMLSSQRCGARTRSGKPCAAPAVSGKKRCRMHGGAHGSGAPRGNKNALKHGLYTREAIAQRRQLRQLIRQSRNTLMKTH